MMQSRWETGNLYEEITGYSRHGGELPTDPAKRRAVLRSMLALADSQEPLAGKTLQETKADGLIREEVTYTLHNGITTRATLLRPDSPRKGMPAVVALHDHGGYYYHGRKKLLSSPEASPGLEAFQQQYYGGRSWPEALARKGYVVLIPDAFYFGSRRLEETTLPDSCREKYFAPCKGLAEGSDAYISAYNEACGLYEREMVKHLLVSPVTWPGILVSDDMRAVDYLAARPEVNAEHIGCCGLSIGGFRSALLCGMDPRIRCAVVVCWMNTFADLQFTRLRDHTFMLYIPHLLRQFDLPDITGLCAPNPLLVQQCMRDDLFSHEGMRQAETILARHYHNAGAASRFKAAWYDSPHAFTLPMQADAFAWLDKHL